MTDRPNTACPYYTPDDEDDTDEDELIHTGIIDVLTEMMDAAIDDGEPAAPAPPDPCSCHHRGDRYEDRTVTGCETPAPDVKAAREEIARARRLNGEGYGRGHVDAVLQDAEEHLGGADE